MWLGYDVLDGFKDVMYDWLVCDVVGLLNCFDKGLVVIMNVSD